MLPKVSIMVILSLIYWMCPYPKNRNFWAFVLGIKYLDFFCYMNFNKDLAVNCSRPNICYNNVSCEFYCFYIPKESNFYFWGNVWANSLNCVS